MVRVNGEGRISHGPSNPNRPFSMMSCSMKFPVASQSPDLNSADTPAQHVKLLVSKEKGKYSAFAADPLKYTFGNVQSDMLMSSCASSLISSE